MNVSRCSTHTEPREHHLLLDLTVDEAEGVCDELWARVVLAESHSLGGLYRALHQATHPGMAP